MLASGLPDIIADPEELARFLFSLSHFNSKSVKPAAFLPSPDHETSVFRHGAEPREELWILATEHAAGMRTVKAAALLNAGQVRIAGLDAVADEPPPRHAVLRGWPLNDNPHLQKAQQKERAILLAQAAVLLER